MKERNNEILSIWEKINNEKSVWEYLNIEDSKIYFNKNNKKIFLSSFNKKDLPLPDNSLKLSGKVLVNLSDFANIMFRRPGTEEVTFYSIINKPQGGCIRYYFDKLILDIVAPPISWRRHKLEYLIKDSLKKYLIEYREPFTFIDIGCGCGFDSLEIERIILGMDHIIGNKIFDKNYEIFNIDIDTPWLNNNKKLSKIMFGNKSKINRYNISIFDYLREQSNFNKFSFKNNLIISCNGFAEFLNDEDLKKLYIGIYNLACNFYGDIRIILPFANKNEKQEKLGRRIGFNFRAKEKCEIIKLIKETFINFKISYIEKFSQIVVIVEKNTYLK